MNRARSNEKISIPRRRRGERGAAVEGGGREIIGIGGQWEPAVVTLR